LLGTRDRSIPRVETASVALNSLAEIGIVFTLAISSRIGALAQTEGA